MKPLHEFGPPPLPYPVAMFTRGTMCPDPYHNGYGPVERTDPGQHTDCASVILTLAGTGRWRVVCECRNCRAENPDTRHYFASDTDRTYAQDANGDAFCPNCSGGIHPQLGQGIPDDRTNSIIGTPEDLRQIYNPDGDPDADDPPCDNGHEWNLGRCQRCDLICEHQRGFMDRCEWCGIQMVAIVERLNLEPGIPPPLDLGEEMDPLVVGRNP